MEKIDLLQVEDHSKVRRLTKERSDGDHEKLSTKESSSSTVNKGEKPCILFPCNN